MFLVGHVTGSATVPVLSKGIEYIIDCSVLLDGGTDSRFRTLRQGHKNPFCAVNELGVFATEKPRPLKVVNPSAISRGEEETSGSSVMVVWEGRPLLVEIQALVDYSPQLANPLPSLLV